MVAAGEAAGVGDHPGRRLRFTEPEAVRLLTTGSSPFELIGQIAEAARS